LDFHFDVVIRDAAAIVRCSGRLIESAASARLYRRVSEVLAETSEVVINLGDVRQVDSFGLGMLTRLLSIVQLGGGSMKLCAVPPHVARVLAVTHLDRLIDVYATEDAACAALASTRPVAGNGSLDAEILCVDPAAEIVRLIQDMLRVDGLRVWTARNIADARARLRTAEPRAVVIRSELRPLLDARAGDLLRVPVIELPSDFASRDPVAAASDLRGRLQALGVAGEGTGQSPSA